MFSALATEMLARAQVDNVRRLAEAGESAHRYMTMLDKEKKAKKTKREHVPQPAFRQSWEDATYVSTQAGGVAGVRR